MSTLLLLSALNPISTNEIATARAIKGAKAGTVIVAHSQSNGRGRRGSYWESKPGNIYASIILRPNCNPLLASQASFVASLAVWDTVKEQLPKQIPVFCKWPNDILIMNKKVSGILLETHTTNFKLADPIVDWLVVGVGINLITYPKFYGAMRTMFSAEGKGCEVLATISPKGPWP